MSFGHKKNLFPFMYFPCRQRINQVMGRMGGDNFGIFTVSRQQGGRRAKKIYAARSSEKYLRRRKLSGG